MSDYEHSANEVLHRHATVISHCVKSNRKQIRAKGRRVK